jgi:hypothetical protein
MRYSSNISNVGRSSLSRTHRFNNATGGPVQVTPDQLGINITKSVFGWKYAASGVKAPNGADFGTNTAATNYINQYGLPFIFVVGGNQILLPPVVQAGGTAVPQLPAGLSVIWASSFMGVPIPSNFFTPVSKAGELSLSAIEIVPANYFPNLTSRANGSQSSGLLISNGVTTGPNMGETLLRLLMAMMQCLIYSYSSYPWGNGYDDLSSACMTGRNYVNWLVYPYQKATFLANVVNQTAPIFINAVEPVLNVALDTVGLGGVAQGVENSALNPALKKAAASAIVNPNQAQINVGGTTGVLPSGTTVAAGSTPSQLVAPNTAAALQSSSTENTWLLIGAALVLAFIIFVYVKE